jgi:cyclic lactone autoinducer peptide
MKKQKSARSLDQIVVKVVASLARSIARDGVRVTSEAFIYQPPEPKELEKRMQTMSKR